MSPISRSFVIFLFLCAGLSACTTAAPLSIATPFPTETLTPTVPPPLPTPSLTPEPTATEAPYDVDVETARQRAIIENAPNNIQEFSYLQSDEYLASLREKNAKGELPQISPNAVAVPIGTISLVIDKPPSNVFEKYGGDYAITFTESWRWRLREKQPWTVVDAGLTEVGETEVGFYVLKWKSLDGSEAFWGYLFIPPADEKMPNYFYERIDRNHAGYPSLTYIKSIDLCIKDAKRYSASNPTDYCKFIAPNPETAFPVEILRDWNETGVLKLDWLPWSNSSAPLIK